MKKVEMDKWRRQNVGWFCRTARQIRTVDQFCEDVEEAAVVKLNQTGYFLALTLMLGLGAGLVGPFGTYVYAPLGPRLLYWIVTIAGGCFLWRGLELLGRKLVPDWPYEWDGLIVVVPFSLLNPLFLVSLHSVLNSFLGARFPTEWSDFVASHLMLSAFVILPTIYVSRKMILDAETNAGRQTINLLFEKLPAKLRGAAPYALSAEGNYVRVHTERGDDLVMSTFEEALRAVSGIPGVRTHRSWWVAESAVRQVEKSGSSYKVTLSSGLEAPLGRRRRSAMDPIIQRLKDS